MNYGAGWVLIEESYHHGTRSLLSILPPRRTARDVAGFMEQLYIDRFASIRERLSYKKSRKSAAYKVVMNRLGGVMDCGHDPMFVAIYAHKIMLQGNEIEFVYRVVANLDTPLNPKFEERSQSLVVDD